MLFGRAAASERAQFACVRAQTRALEQQLTFWRAREPPNRATKRASRPTLSATRPGAALHPTAPPHSCLRCPRTRTATQVRSGARVRALSRSRALALTAKIARARSMDGAPPPEEEPVGTLAERLVHKSKWKWRAGAYDELAALFAARDQVRLRARF